jgi:hypothetical protein
MAGITTARPGLPQQGKENLTLDKTHLEIRLFIKCSKITSLVDIFFFSFPFFHFRDGNCSFLSRKHCSVILEFATRTLARSLVLVKANLDRGCSGDHFRQQPCTTKKRIAVFLGTGKRLIFVKSVMIYHADRLATVGIITENISSRVDGGPQHHRLCDSYPSTGGGLLPYLPSGGSCSYLPLP